ncbi:uncharacterized protein MELLADRAFT_75502 [Melampsora larici-populina 98AG31]|uniref:Secreted protein n=1 Tax=Melampsora larici-populina (strain 98AG31 / pathotype 3-4-7) TaxID=747676 RepID=F4RZF5_MELLP|nr:uncharacterized protein MELLADRAFT_75502 [Melampsora larici-populina 98AG31]EGG02264.1 hypothetical protein MELLADRAFT_75502 [Melampsora larici-populina 98AG31]
MSALFCLRCCFYCYIILDSSHCFYDYSPGVPEENRFFFPAITTPRNDYPPGYSHPIQAGSNPEPAGSARGDPIFPGSNHQRTQSTSQTRIISSSPTNNPPNSQMTTHPRQIQFYLL